MSIVLSSFTRLPSLSHLHLHHLHLHLRFLLPLFHTAVLQLSSLLFLILSYRHVLKATAWWHLVLCFVSVFLYLDAILTTNTQLVSFLCQDLVD